MTGGFAQPNVAGDDRLEYLVFEMTSHLMSYLMGEVISNIEHGEKYSLDLQFWIENLFNQSDRF